jgi:glutaredoxin-related protein
VLDFINFNINLKIIMNNIREKKTQAKHLLFFSNFCEFSNETCKKIDKLNIKENFIMINISQKKYKIPSNITTVPTILLNDRKTILQEDKIDQFLDQIYSKLNKNIDPFADTNGISNNFAFLDETSNKNMSSKFGSTNEEFRIITPPEDNNDPNSGSITDRMNNMQQSRNSDIQQFFKK